jgi:hypothetical protein
VIAGWVPRIHKTIARLREVLGDQHYQSLAHRGKRMTTAEVVAYAYEQVDEARRELGE